MLPQGGGTSCGPQVDTASRHQILGLHDEDLDLKPAVEYRHHDQKKLDRETGEYCDLRNYRHADGKLDEQVDRSRRRVPQYLERRWAGIGLDRHGRLPDVNALDWRDDFAAVRVYESQLQVSMSIIDSTHLKIVTRPRMAFLDVRSTGAMASVCHDQVMKDFED